MGEVTLRKATVNACLTSPKFSCCDEVAMVRVLHESGEAHDRGPLSLPVGGMPMPRIKL